jgi:flagellar basal-body rod modification protein FlgD
MSTITSLQSSSPAQNAAAAAASSAANDAASAAAAAADPAAASDRFLTLLITQLQNQDPLNPMDNAQITTQLAQISTVSGINKLNDTLSALAASVAANQSLLAGSQAASLLGRDVEVAGNALDLSGTATGAFKLAGAADAVTITIKDAAGNTVRTIKSAAGVAGDQTFAWDGRTDAGAAAADGRYSFSVGASSNGTPVVADTLYYAHVLGVTPGAGGATLQLPGGTSVTLAQVVEIH